MLWLWESFLPCCRAPPTAPSLAIWWTDPKAGRDGHFFLAINIAAFEEVEGFKRRVDKIVREVHGSRRADGVERVLVPGELEANFERTYTTEGIPLAGTTINDIADQAETLRVDASTLFV